LETASLADVQKEIKSGADVNARNEYVLTPLMLASFSNPNPEVITFLIKNFDLYLFWYPSTIITY